jgi:hypothetical protein
MKIHGVTENEKQMQITGPDPHPDPHPHGRLASCGTGQQDEASPITVRLAAPHNAYIENFDTNLYKLWLEEQTGLVIEMAVG